MKNKHPDWPPTDIGRVNGTTALLGIDFSSTSRPPMVFVTMIFGGQYDEVADYTPAWGGAAVAHEERCDMLMEYGVRKAA